MCHGEQVQMKNLRLDSSALVKQHAQAIYQQAVVQKLMPMNNATQMTDEERAEWLEVLKPVHEEMADRIGADLIQEAYQAIGTN
jgi:uncharacterized membrane protein